MNNTTDPIKTPVPRWLKLMLKIAGVILCVILILWMVVAAYVYSHKEELLKTVSAQLNENLNGTLTIERMEPSLIRGFPGISVALENVLLRDSLWERHKHDLLKAKNVYIAIDAFSIFTGSPTIKDIRISNGSVYLFTDTNGVRNTDIFKKKPKKGEGSAGEGKINRVFLNNVSLTVDDKRKDKLFKFAVDDFLGKIYYKSGGWEGEVSLKAKVEEFAFNLAKGSFLKDQLLNMDLEMSYNDDDHQLTIPMQEIRIGKEDLNVGGKFSFDPEFSDFQLDVEAGSILFSNARTLLSSHIASKLKPYEIRDPIQVRASIKGQLKGGGEPLIAVSWNVRDNILSSAGLTITHCSFTGNYNNQWIPGKGRNDPNSRILFDNMKGRYFEIPFVADSIRITDLKNPVFTGRFKSSFPLNKLNSILGGRTFEFSRGNAQLDLVYKAPFKKDAEGQRFIYGFIKVINARAEYKPRDLDLKDMSMTMSFSGRDLFISNVKVKSGGSSLSMEGSVKDFSNLYYSDPQKMMINWKVSSPQINLSEFLGFVGNRKTTAQRSTKAGSAGNVSAKLDQILDQARMKMDVSISRLIYKRFVASGVKAGITLRQSGILINNVSLQHGGGRVNLTGSIDQSGTNNRFVINSKINNVDVQKLFYAFDNFGQDAIISDNLRGSFFGGTAISGTMTDKGGIVPRSFRGTVTFDIRNGALVNFDPMLRLGKFAFANRDFSNIRFTNLKNTLNIQGNKVIIPAMAVRSNVLNVFLDGVYSFSTGTDIAIRIPLRNPEKDADISDRAEKRARELRGIVINVRALDGDDGNVRFRLGKRAPAADK